MPLTYEYIVYKEGKNHSKYVCTVFFGIIMFILVYFPLFGSDMRYEFGQVFSLIFHSIGTILLFFGVICVLFGVLYFFFHNPAKGIGFLFFGIILIAFAGYFLSPGSFGTASSGESVPKGYH